MSEKRHHKGCGPWGWDMPPHGHGGPFDWNEFGAAIPGLLRGIFGGSPGYGPGFHGMGMGKGFFGGFEEEFEDKEDAVTFLKFQKAHIKKRKRHLEKALKRMESIEGELDNFIDEVSKMESYTPEEFKKIIKKKVAEHMSKYFEEQE